MIVKRKGNAVMSHLIYDLIPTFDFNLMAHIHSYHSRI